MNNVNDRSDLLKDMAVIEYLAGDQSESVRLNFERELEQNPGLREAVEIERRFQADMRNAGELEAVSMSNFDVLLSTIEAQENNETRGHKVTSIVSNENKSVRLEKKSASVHFLGKNYFAMAASVAVFAIVFAGFYLNSSTPKFETLSDTTASEEINFAYLTAEVRLAKMIFVENVLEQQIDDVLQRYNLSTFEAGGELNQRYIIAESAISDLDLRLWRDDPLIQQVELFATTKEK